MALCSFSENYLMLGVTPVENLFIQEYLPRASGDYVRVYLYGLMQCYHPAEDMTLDRTARILDLPEETVRDAFQYWERQGLVKRVSDRPVSYQYLNIASTMFNGSSAEQEIYRHRDFNNQLQQIFGNRLLHAAEFNSACEWVEDLHLPESVVLIMAEAYVARHGAKCQFKSLDKIAVKWAEEGIVTDEQAREKVMQESEPWKLCQQVLKQLNIHRKPTKAEANMARKWLEEWNLSPKAVIAACKETVNARNPNFGYLDGILKRHANIVSGAEMEQALIDDNRVHEAIKQLHETLGLGFVSPMPNEIKNYRGYLDVGFAPETIQRIASELAETRPKANMDLLDKAMKASLERGQTSLEEVEAHLERQRMLRGQAAQIFAACGLEKSVTAADVSLLEDWLSSAPFDLVLYAAECAKGKTLPTNYMTKILAGWQRLDLNTVELARRYQESKASGGAAAAASSRTGATPNALNFQQRTYQEGELDYLFDQAKKYDSEEDDDDAQ